MKLSSKLVWAVGSFSYGLGKVTRNGVADNGKVVGFTTEDNVPFFRGELYNLDETDIEEIADFVGKTATLDLDNGTTINFKKAWTVNDDGLTGNTKEGTISIHVQAEEAKVIKRGG